MPIFSPNWGCTNMTQGAPTLAKSGISASEAVPECPFSRATKFFAFQPFKLTKGGAITTPAKRRPVRAPLTLWLIAILLIDLFLRPKHL